MNIHRIVAHLIGAALLALSEGVAQAEPVGEVIVSAGYFDVLAHENDALETQVTVRSQSLWRDVGLQVGLAATSDEATYFGAGPYIDLPIDDRWRVTASFMAGVYGNGDGKDLGNDLEFQTQLELGRRISDQTDVGIFFNHRSNAGMGYCNSGSETVGLFLRLRLG